MTKLNVSQKEIIETLEKMNQILPPKPDLIDLSDPIIQEQYRKYCEFGKCWESLSDEQKDEIGSKFHVNPFGITYEND